MEQKRFYPDMSPEQQLQWVTDFEALMTGGGNRIVEQARSRSPQFAADDAPLVRRIVSLLAAWPFAADFCDKAQRYGDYMARTSRLPVYVDKVKERLADGLTMTDAEGRTVAYVSPSAPMRRRGRPSAAEVAARLRGEALVAPAADTPETLKRRRIAALLGLQVIVHGDAPREKNNAELAADRAARRAEYDRQNPSLFGPADTTAGAVGTSGSSAAARESSGTGSMRAVEDGTLVPVPSDSPVPQSGTSAYRVKASSPDAAPTIGEVGQFRPAAGSSVEHAAVPQQPLQCPTMSEVYQDRIEQDRLRLSDLAWLCSDDLRKRIETVRALRVTAESASERAKTMADLGQPADAIAPYAQQAKEAVESYQAIYQAVDEELAIQFKRLSLDQPYIDRFRARFKGVDIEKVLHICRPYYEKVKENERADADRMAEKGILTIDERIRLLIERDNPEYAAKLKAEEEKKQELQALHRYIMRKDKGPSDERCKTLAERIERVRALAGDEVADSYLPILAKTKEENAKLHAAEAAASDKPTDTVGTVPAVGSDAQERTTEGLSPSVSVAPKERKKSATSKKPSTAKPSAKSSDTAKKPSPKKPAK